MRFVPVKNIEQQTVLALHRVRQGFVRARTAQANQIRGLLSEFGFIIPQGIGCIVSRVPELIEDGANELPGQFRILVQRLLDHLPETNPYWNSNWEFQPSAITPENQLSCGFWGFFKGDYIAPLRENERVSLESFATPDATNKNDVIACLFSSLGLALEMCNCTAQEWSFGLSNGPLSVCHWRRSRLGEARRNALLCS